MKNRILKTILSGILIMSVSLFIGYCYGIKKAWNEVKEDHDYLKNVILYGDDDAFRFYINGFWFPHGKSSFFCREQDTVEVFFMAMAMASLYNPDAYYDAYEIGKVLFPSEDSLSIPMRCLQMGENSPRMSHIAYKYRIHRDSSDVLWSEGRPMIDLTEDRVKQIKNEYKITKSCIYYSYKYRFGTNCKYAFKYNDSMYIGYFWSDTIWNKGDSIVTYFNPAYPSDNICLSNREFIKKLGQK